jgi:hypothetical protein
MASRLRFSIPRVTVEVYTVRDQAKRAVPEVAVVLVVIHHRGKRDPLDFSSSPMTFPPRLLMPYRIRTDHFNPKEITRHETSHPR